MSAAASTTIRDLYTKRATAWRAVQSLETGLIAAPDSEALAQAISDKRAEFNALSQLIRRAERRVAAERSGA